MRLSLLALLIWLVWAAWQFDVSGQIPSPTYEEVKIIFEDNCTMCHNGSKAPKGLRLESYESLMKGGDRGPVVKPGNPDESELIHRVRGKSLPRMPLSGPPWLDESEIMVLEGWIRNGAPRAATMIPAAEVLSEDGVKLIPNGPVTYSDVAPIFKSNCMKCHNHKGLMGPAPEGLQLGTYQQVITGTERAYVIPGNPDASELVRKIRGQSIPRMPFDGPPYLNGEQAALIEKWVEQGAMDEGGQRAEVPVGRKVRLRGSLTGIWSLDNLPLGIDDRAEIKKRPGIGDYVEVRGTVTKDGGIAVERIRTKVKHGTEERHSP